MRTPKRKPGPEKKRDWIALLASVMAVLGWGLLIWVNLPKPPPLEIKSIHAPNTIQTGQTASIRVFATGGDEINYTWDAARGKIQQNPFQEPQATYIAPKLPGGDVITVIVYDEKGEEDKDFETVTIVERGEK